MADWNSVGVECGVEQRETQRGTTTNAQGLEWNRGVAQRRSDGTTIKS
jgi:hypothetical protein